MNIRKNQLETVFTKYNNNFIPYLVERDHNGYLKGTKTRIKSLVIYFT